MIKLIYEEKGYDFVPSRKERRKENFIEDLKSLVELRLEANAFMRTRDEHVLKFSGDTVEYSYFTNDEKIGEVSYVMTLDRSECIGWIEELGIDEWKRKNFALVLDGVEWELTLKYAHKMARPTAG